MKFTVQEVVRGATRFEGNIDGESIKSAAIFMDVSLEADGTGWGVRTEARRCEKLDVIDRIKSIPFPFKAEIVFEEKATKGKVQLVVLDVKPLQK